MDYFSPSLFAILIPLDWEKHLKHTGKMDFGGAFTAFNEQSVKYLVVGGLAMNLHGIPRIVGYLDLLVDFKSDNLGNFLSALKSLEYIPQAPLESDELLNPKKRAALVKENGLMVFTFTAASDPSKRIDILLDPPADFEEVYDRKKDVPFGKQSIPALSLDDMILWKSGSSRKQDTSDVEALKTVRRLHKVKNDIRS